MAPQTEPITPGNLEWRERRRQRDAEAEGLAIVDERALPRFLEARCADVDIDVSLQDQLGALQRELLLTIRALIDWYLERLEDSRRATVVEDIPID